MNLTRDDLQSLSSDPKVVTSITALFNMYKTTRTQLDSMLGSLARDDQSATVGATSDKALRFDHTPFDEVIDFLQSNGNWFPSIEEKADALRREAGEGARLTSRELADLLRTRFDVEVRLVPPSEHSSVVRRWDAEGSVLTLSSTMFEQRLRFQLAHTLGLRMLDREKLHEKITAGYATRHSETPKLIKIHLANYFAGALLLPYDDFFREVTRTRYDVEALASTFESSYETVAHRLCNLSDPKKKGIPFHFSRVDVAGNISKRYSATGIHFPGSSGSCPKWAVNLAFLTPNVITRQYSVFPDGATYFCFAKVVTQPEQGSLARGTVYSIGLGTYADNAKYLVYADDMPFADPRKMAVPVGSTCRFCERTDCNQRAAPSYKYAFHVDEYTKKDNFFSPLVESDQGRRAALAPFRKK
ncbi:MAG: DUF2083 domain-containing protein [Sandaracinaceae bacterium]|nr:DUF2083 domain-containing protein [Sandaracinaceae bacterium]